ncbi:ElyC/SanA/YdcF family protein [Ornithinimicrobium flavum]|uniref:ElyC/SanA/YdcF family protein n=1 Tax=Ornithinimicrobium flavum TaxID=1288636 RepID=UPI00106FC34B|nr:ElyC/SanA/YdcF family protein [Ornithinimicrobium flavum]
MSIPTGLLAVWLWVVVDHVAHPEVDPRQEVDAVYVLGPVETRIEQTLAVMDSGVAPVLLATTSINQETGDAYATDHCGLVTDRYRVECVVPEPYNTRGEAAVLAAAVEENGWERVAVITSTPHTARARMLMERCVDADILMWPVERDERRSWSAWLGSFVYESGAWVKTQVVKDCYAGRMNQ